MLAAEYRIAPKEYSQLRKEWVASSSLDVLLSNCIHKLTYGHEAIPDKICALVER